MIPARKGGVVMKINTQTVMKLISPVLVFPVLYIPYSLLNSTLLVKWLGCGCPKVDVSGEMIHDYFSANDFTAIFWFAIAVGVTIISGLVSKQVFKERKQARVFYVAGVFVVSLFAAYWIIQRMMWN